MTPFLIATLMVVPFASDEDEQDIEPLPYVDEDAGGHGATRFGLHFVLEAMPGTVLLSPESEGFRAQGESAPGRIDEQEVKGIASWMPNLRLGLGFETKPLFIDILGGGGAVWNDAFLSWMVEGVAAVRFKLGEVFGFPLTLGPEGGVVYFFEPEWSDDISSDFDGSLGFLGGLHVTWGTRALSLSISADYLYSKVDANPNANFTTSHGELDISGALIQVGIITRFPW
jgi:hypothetical protein